MMYIQYKAFDTINSLNDWLRNFIMRPDKEMNKTQLIATNLEGYSMLQLLDIQWIPHGNVSGDEAQIAGNIGNYAIVKYGVLDVKQ